LGHGSCPGTLDQNPYQKHHKERIHFSSQAERAPPASNLPLHRFLPYNVQSPLFKIATKKQSTNSPAASSVVLPGAYAVVYIFTQVLSGCRGQNLDQKKLNKRSRNLSEGLSGSSGAVYISIQALPGCSVGCCCWL